MICQRIVIQRKDNGWELRHGSERRIFEDAVTTTTPQQKAAVSAERLIDEARKRMSVIAHDRWADEDSRARLRNP